MVRSNILTFVFLLLDMERESPGPRASRDHGFGLMASAHTIDDVATLSCTLSFLYNLHHFAADANALQSMWIRCMRMLRGKLNHFRIPISDHMAVTLVFTLISALPGLNIVSSLLCAGITV